MLLKYPHLIHAAPSKGLFEDCPSHTRRAAICPFRSLALLTYILTLMTNVNYRKYFLQEVISFSLMTDNQLRKPGLKTKAQGDSFAPWVSQAAPWARAEHVCSAAVAERQERDPLFPSIRYLRRRHEETEAALPWLGHTPPLGRAG